MNAQQTESVAPRSDALTPEEDSIGDPGEPEEEIDDFLPADLWY
jgi:hypothetical protein